MSRRSGYGLLTVALFAIAVAVRALPFYTSTLPTPHGFAYVPGTNYVVETGELLVAGRTDHFFWHTFLAEASLILGVEPLGLLRPISALIGALPVVLAVAVTRQLCAHNNWPSRRTWTAAALAGLFMGVQGLYLYRSMAPHPNTIGLFLLPLFVITLHRAYVTQRLAWWIATLAILVILPPLHVFVSLAAAIMVTILAAIVVVRAPTLRKPLPVLAVTGILWLYVPGFHYALRAITPTRIAYTDRVTAVPGLYVAWIVLGVIGTVWLIHATPRTQRALGWSVFGVLFGLLAINAVTPVFHGAPMTPTPILVGLLPLAVLVALAVWRLPDATAPSPVGPPLVAIVAGAIVIIGVTLTSLPTVVHLTTAERVNYFMHFPLMVLAGVGGATLLARMHTPAPHTVRSAVTVGLILCAAASIPIALAGVPVLPYENSVTDAELAATTFSMTAVEGNWTTDKQINDIAARIGPDPAPSSAALVATANTPTWSPTHDWLQAPDTGPPGCYILGKASWSEGAMFYPQPVESIDAPHYTTHVTTANSLYHGGGSDTIRLSRANGEGTIPC